jgi:hypothetical protein
VGGSRRPVSLDDYFAGQPQAARLHRAVAREIARLPGEVDTIVQRSQVGFHVDGHPFAATWMPRRYLGRGAPLVLTVFSRRRLVSPRWKEVVQVAAGHFTHHLELWGPDEVDDELRAVLKDAYRQAKEAGSNVA